MYFSFRDVKQLLLISIDNISTELVLMNIPGN